MVAEVDGLGALQVRIAGQRPVDVLFGAPDQRRHQPCRRRLRLAPALAGIHNEVGGNLVVARAGRVQLAANRPDQLGQMALDRHVDVFVTVHEDELALLQLKLHLVEAVKQRVAVLGGDDLLCGKHLRVRARLGNVLRP